MDAPSNRRSLRARLETTLEPFVYDVLAAFDLAGMAVGVVASGELVYSHGFGVRNLNTREPVTARSLFHLASISKPLVATAIVQLVERGKVDLDAPVAAYLPYFKLKDARAGEITVRQMLTHTSGMPDVVDYRWYAPEEDDGALERFVRSLAGEELVTAPGEKFAYSNMAFEVLGDVIAKVSGQTFEDYVKTNILAPLEMHDSTFLRREVRPELAVTPHFGAPLRVLEGAYPYHRGHAPSSTFHSSIQEMARWAVANLNHGRLGDETILQAQSYDLLWQPYVQTGEETWEEAVGLSWFLGTYRGRRVVHHGGSDPGFNAEVVLVPAEEAAVVVMANANTSAVGIVADAAQDLLFGHEPQPPKPPITVPIGATLAAEGHEAAVVQYQQLLRTDPERYDGRPARFLDATWGAVEVHRTDAIRPLVELWVELQPDAALAHEMLGWVCVVEGQREAAAGHLRQALALDPESLHAEGLLRELPGGG